MRRCLPAFATAPRGMYPYHSGSALQQQTVLAEEKESSLITHSEVEVMELPQVRKAPTVQAPPTVMAPPRMVYQQQQQPLSPRMAYPVQYQYQQPQQAQMMVPPQYYGAVSMPPMFAPPPVFAPPPAALPAYPYPPQQELVITPGPLEYIEMVDGTLGVLLDLLRNWSRSTESALGVKARVSLPPSPEPVEFVSPDWKLPIDLPPVPSIGSTVSEKAKFIQEAVTVLMIFLDELNPEGDEYIRGARKSVLMRLEAVSTGADAWIRAYELAAMKSEMDAVREPERRSRRSRRERRNRDEGRAERKEEEDDSSECDCSDCEGTECSSRR